MRWSVVVPMWQESVRITGTIERLASSALAERDVEFVFVDDGSTDHTAEICREGIDRCGLPASVAVLERNRGKGAAVRHGVQLARGKVVGFCDADLSCSPEDLVRVYSVVDRGEAPIAIASRTEVGTVIAQRQPLARRLSGSLFNLQLRALGLTDFHDTQCGLKAFDAQVAHELFSALQTDRFAFDVELLARARRAGIEVVELPVTWQHVEASRVDPFRDGTRMFLDTFRIRWMTR